MHLSSMSLNLCHISHLPVSLCCRLWSFLSDLGFSSLIMVLSISSMLSNLFVKSLQFQCLFFIYINSIWFSFDFVYSFLLSHVPASCFHSPVCLCSLSDIYNSDSAGFYQRELVLCLYVYIYKKKYTFVFVFLWSCISWN